MFQIYSSKLLWVCNICKYYSMFLANALMSLSYEKLVSKSMKVAHCFERLILLSHHCIHASTTAVLVFLFQCWWNIQVLLVFLIFHVISSWNMLTVKRGVWFLLLWCRKGSLVAAAWAFIYIIYAGTRVLGGWIWRRIFCTK